MFGRRDKGERLAFKTERSSTRDEAIKANLQNQENDNDR